MEEMGVISRVSKPTDWVSSLVYSRKSSGRLRICLDPKDLNRAIKRPHYHTRTLEEITHKLAGATVSSKLDARHGYWFVSLDEKSSMKTTFNSPFVGTDSWDYHSAWTWAMMCSMKGWISS